MRKNNKSFLFPSKKYKCDGKCAPNECLCDTQYMKEQNKIYQFEKANLSKLYTIEEIEKAIDKEVGEHLKRAIINNLKK